MVKKLTAKMNKTLITDCDDKNSMLPALPKGRSKAAPKSIEEDIMPKFLLYDEQPIM